MADEAGQIHGVLDYRTERVGSTTLVSKPSLLTALTARLQSFSSLYDWAAAEPQPRALRGRAVVYVAALSECNRTVVVRHAWHGGIFAPLTGDRFLVPTRAPREAAVSMMLRSAGVPTPDLVAYALYPAGPGLRRVDVLTEYVPDAYDWGSVLAGDAPSVDGAMAEAAVQQLLLQLAQAGAVHPDLNVKNVLLSTEEESGEQSSRISHKHHRAQHSARTKAPKAWIVDVDVVRFVAQTPHTVMARNLRRLVRSVEKWHLRSDIPLDQAWLADFAVRMQASIDG